MWPEHIKHVALVGWPKSGKSTVADMLCEEFGGVLVDDGGILRQAASILFGVPIADFYTQEGKAAFYDVCGKPVQGRIMLGELGNYLETAYSPDFMPDRGIKIARAEHADAPFTVFGSVRRDQGRVYQANGGIVIHVDNPTVEASPNVWDAWNPDFVDLTIYNDPTTVSLDDLRKRVRYVAEQVRGLRR